MTRQNLDGVELEFANMLVEDTNNGGMSYMDCGYLHSATLNVLADTLHRRPIHSPAGRKFGKPGSTLCVS